MLLLGDDRERLRVSPCLALLADEAHSLWLHREATGELFGLKGGAVEERAKYQRGGWLGPHLCELG